MSYIQEIVKKLANDVGFDQHNMAAAVAGLFSEGGEVADVVSKLSLGKKTKPSDNLSNLKEQLELEIADVLVFLSHIANKYDIDLNLAVIKKAGIIRNRFLKKEPDLSTEDTIKTIDKWIEDSYIPELEG